MEEKSFSWLLFEMSKAKVAIKITEVGICRGTALLSWYYNDSMGVVSRKMIKKNSKTKIILSNFLNQRSLIFEEYNPDKLIAYIYHLKGTRLVKAKEAIELAENQIHGLQVRSVHLSLSSSLDTGIIYRLRAHHDNGEIVNELTMGSVNKEHREEVKDQVIYERAIDLTIALTEFLYSTQGMQLNELILDLALDQQGQFYMLRLHKLILMEDLSRPESFVRRIGKIIPSKPDSSNESIEEGANEINLHKNFLEFAKKKEQGRIIRKQVHQNSPLFLEMMAKTFDKERKIIENEETIRIKKIEYEARTCVSSPKLNKINSQRSLPFKIKGNKHFSNMNELLGYLEASRPKVWLKDKDVYEGYLSPSVRISSPVSEKLYLEGSHSDTNRGKKDTKTNFLASPSSFKTRYQKDLDSYVNNERLRLKNKIINKERVKNVGELLAKTGKLV